MHSECQSMPFSFTILPNRNFYLDVNCKDYSKNEHSVTVHTVSQNEEQDDEDKLKYTVFNSNKTHRNTGSNE